MTDPAPSDGSPPDAAGLRRAAAQVLRENDRGTYTVPTKGLYPFQWNWDSCLTALGLSHLDPGRAWTEIETLFAHQWDDGMVPHMVFHEAAPGYFPGPDVWSTGRTPPTSGITQLPVAGFAVHRLWQRTGGAEADRRAATLLAALDRWHGWFHRTRDPGGTGLVAVIHPWESRDNSVDWDAALAGVPTDGVPPYSRNDTKHADPGTRPTQAEYDRYLWLVQHFRGLGWDGAKLHDASPFRIVDPGFNAILVRSELDTADLADRLGLSGIAARNRSWAEAGLAALETLWDDRAGQYQPFDRATGRLLDSPSIGGLLPAFAPIPEGRLRAIAATIEEIGQAVRFLVPSHHPRESRFDLRRYWRGPVWLVCNYLIADGLRQGGAGPLADRIRQDSLDLIGTGGFSEYYDPATGAALGGGRFSWTAAMALEFLADAP